MKIKSLLLTVVLLFTAQNYGAQTNFNIDLKIKFEAKQIASETEQKEAVPQFKKTFISSNVKDFTSWVAFKIDGFNPTCVQFNLDEIMILPLELFKDKQDGQSIELSMMGGRKVKFILESGFAKSLQS